MLSQLKGILPFTSLGFLVRLTKYAISSDRQRLIGKMPTFGVHLIFKLLPIQNSKINVMGEYSDKLEVKRGNLL